VERLLALLCLCDVYMCVYMPLPVLVLGMIGFATTHPGKCHDAPPSAVAKYMSEQQQRQVSTGQRPVDAPLPISSCADVVAAGGCDAAAFRAQVKELCPASCNLCGSGAAAFSVSAQNAENMDVCKGPGHLGPSTPYVNMFAPGTTHNTVPLKKAVCSGKYDPPAWYLPARPDWPLWKPMLAWKPADRWTCFYESGNPEYGFVYSALDLAEPYRLGPCIA